MGDGAKEHEDMPNGMKVEFVVVGKEIGASGIKQSFSKKKTDGKPGKTRHDRLYDQQYTPSHYEVEGKGQFGVFAQGEDFIKGATNDSCPLHSEDRPAYPSAYHTNADGGVGTGYHDVDADMVELAEHILGYAWMHPVVDSAAEKHEKHTHYKEDDTKSHLPPLMHSRPHHPDAG